MINMKALNNYYKQHLINQKNQKYKTNYLINNYLNNRTFTLNQK